jgi:putative sterol carrier protein
MPEKMRYLSREFVDAVKNQLNTDPNYLQKAKNLTGIIALRALDCPDGTDKHITYHFNQGRLLDVVYEEETKPSSIIRNRPFDNGWISRSTSNYEMYTKIDRGEIGVVQALTSPNYKIEGSMFKMMRLMSGMTAMNGVVQKMDKEY